MLFTRILFLMSSPLNDSFSPSNFISCLAFFCAFVTFFNTKQDIFTCTAGKWRACSCYKYSINSSSTLLCFPVVTLFFFWSLLFAYRSGTVSCILRRHRNANFSVELHMWKWIAVQSQCDTLSHQINTDLHICTWDVWCKQPLR